MEHFGLGNDRPGDTMSSSSNDSFVWPNFGSSTAQPTNSTTPSIYSQDQGRLPDTEYPGPPPLPPRRVQVTEDSIFEYSRPAEGQHDGQAHETLETLPGESYTAASKIEAATRQEIRAATLPRRITIALCCAMCLVAAVFLVVAHSGSTRASKTSMNIYLFRMDLSNLFANQTLSADGTANPQAAAAIAQSIGLHDYYQAGLWGFCQGFYASGLSACSLPTPFYWFNPLGILFDELLLKNTLDVPPQAQTVLTVVRVVSQTMFGLFFVGALLAVVLLLASPLVLFSRWFSLPVAVLAGATAGPLVLASLMATFLAVAYRVVAGVAASVTQLRVVVTVGPVMFAMVWAATALSVATFLAHATLGCCATSVRDITTGYRPYVRLPPAATQADEAGIENRAGFVSFLPSFRWPNVRLPKLKLKRRSKPAPTISAPTMTSPTPPPRPAPAPYLSPLALHPIVPSRRQDLELEMPPSHSILSREYL